MRSFNPNVYDINFFGNSFKFQVFLTVAKRVQVWHPDYENVLRPNYSQKYEGSTEYPRYNFVQVMHVDLQLFFS